jgi:hypothetical protein
VLCACGCRIVYASSTVLTCHRPRCALRRERSHTRMVLRTPVTTWARENTDRYVPPFPPPRARASNHDHSCLLPSSTSPCTRPRPLMSQPSPAFLLPASDCAQRFTCKAFNLILSLLFPLPYTGNNAVLVRGVVHWPVGERAATRQGAQHTTISLPFPRPSASAPVLSSSTTTQDSLITQPFVDKNGNFALTFVVLVWQRHAHLRRVTLSLLS